MVAGEDRVDADDSLQMRDALDGGVDGVRILALDHGDDLTILDAVCTDPAIRLNSGRTVLSALASISTIMLAIIMISFGIR
jgi:hypothetical protein